MYVYAYFVVVVSFGVYGVVTRRKTPRFRSRRGTGEGRDVYRVDGTTLDGRKYDEFRLSVLTLGDLSPRPN